MDPCPAPDLTIILLGNSGVGKSASGNTILGQGNVFESRQAFEPVTTQISEKSGRVFGKQITVIDTPGIFGSEEDIKTHFQVLFQSSRPCLFLVVVEINRFTAEQENAVKATIGVIGDQRLKKSFLLFTKGNDFNSESLDEFINRQPDGPIAQLAARFAGRHLFDNINGDQEQVRNLLLLFDNINGDSSRHPKQGAHPLKVRRIVLLGLPGDGKSASANTILGSKQFKSCSSFEAVTTESDSKTAKLGVHELTVVDTPGFTKKVLSPRKLYEEIVKAIVKASPGPHAFIIVVKLGRISEANIILFKMLPEVFGKDALKYTVVIFTHGDTLEGQTIKGRIEKEKCIRDLVSLCGNRYCLFDNTKRGNRQQVRNLLGILDTMDTANSGQYYTPEMFYDVHKVYRNWQKFIEWFEQMLKKIDEYFRSNPLEVTLLSGLQ
ncbi:GTPase IMAP family member 4-like [Brachyistius frenatus]|uniref:GTPase IMAP family member 4-like n=1 Tax=Brachyistius frenatus TaxID=100188 RepID=UPI0037E74010